MRFRLHSFSLFTFRIQFQQQQQKKKCNNDFIVLVHDENVFDKNEPIMKEFNRGKKRFNLPFRYCYDGFSLNIDTHAVLYYWSNEEK